MYIVRNDSFFFQVQVFVEFYRLFLTNKPKQKMRTNYLRDFRFVIRKSLIWKAKENSWSLFLIRNRNKISMKDVFIF